MFIDKLFNTIASIEHIENSFWYLKTFIGIAASFIGIIWTWKKIQSDSLLYHKGRFENIKDALNGTHDLLIEEKTYSAYNFYIPKNLWLKLINSDQPFRNIRLYRSGSQHLKYENNGFNIVEGKVPLKTLDKFFTISYFILAFLGLGILVAIANLEFDHQQISSLLLASSGDKMD